MDVKILWIIGLILLIALSYNYIQISRFRINCPVFYSNKLSRDLRITQISDYHDNKLINKDKLLKEIKYFNPDIIVLTGDIIDFKTEDIEPAVDLVRRIYSINENVFFVLGNHELRNTKGVKFVQRLKEIGVTVLDNDNTVLKTDEDKINIIGLNFFLDRKDYNKSFEGIDEKNFTILLSHSPNRPISYSYGVEDLILSGHTHGGQVRLPLIGAIVAPGQDIFPKYDKGIFKLESAILYIDSGLGNSVFPIRLFNRVQISNITVKPTAEDN